MATKIRKMFVDWDNQVALDEENLYESIYEITESFINPVEFLSDTYNMSNYYARKLYEDLSKEDFYMFDTTMYQEWESQQVDQYLKDAFTAYEIIVNEDDETLYVCYEEGLIGTYESICEDLFSSWYDIERYMIDEHPDVPAEDYDSYVKEYEDWELSNISAYIADYAVKY